MKHDDLCLADKEFLKWSHISEKWLYEYLIHNAQGIDVPREELAEIIEDERRHVSIFKNLLSVFKITEHTDTKKSFHYSIYASIGGVKWDQLKPAQMKAMMAVSERRAVFLYRDYLQNGHNDQIKKTLRSVLKDELGHARAYLDERDPAFLWAAELDKNVWTLLEVKYGRKAQQENTFWLDLQNNKLTTKDSVDALLS